MVRGLKQVRLIRTNRTWQSVPQVKAGYRPDFFGRLVNIPFSVAFFVSLW
jgi:hypothetical protein